MDFYGLRYESFPTSSTEVNVRRSFSSVLRRSESLRDWRDFRAKLVQGGMDMMDGMWGGVAGYTAKAPEK